MKIVSVCACTSGIAHTYIAKEKLIEPKENAKLLEAAVKDMETINPCS